MKNISFRSILLTVTITFILISAIGNIVESTPGPSKKPSRQQLDFNIWSPIPTSLKPSVTGESTVTALDSTLRLLSINEDIGTLDGDPFEKSVSEYTCSTCSTDCSESDNEKSSDESDSELNVSSGSSERYNCHCDFSV